jgi:hypothetical protein
MEQNDWPGASFTADHDLITPSKTTIITVLPILSQQVLLNCTTP